MSSMEGEGSGFASNDPPAQAVEPSGSPGGRPTNKLAVAMTLAVIAVAGVVIVRNLPPRPWFTPTLPQQAPPSAVGTQGPPPSTVEPATLSRLILMKSGEAGAMTAMLGRAVAPKSLGMMSGESTDILLRELVRQAVLIAARDERGLATRDELLDDAPVVVPEDPQGLIIATSELGARTDMELRSICENGCPPLLIEKLGVHTDEMSEEDYLINLQARHVALVEKLSRTKFPDVLDDLGVKGEPNKYQPDAPVPAGVEDKLQTLGLVDHFEAIRELHKAIRTDGESPARLGALARAYAQLAALTGHLWNAAHLAFEARAWLYAQRMVARDPESSWALRHRAFVGALNGVHGSSLHDLETAAAIDAKSPDAVPAPDWVEVIEAGMKYDLKRLDGVAAPYDRLAAFLKMTDVEFPSSTRQVVHAAEVVVKRDPDCGRAFDVICGNGDINDLHRATVLALKSYQHFFRTKLAAVPGLPERIQKALERQADDQALDEALSDAGRPGVDDGEVAWGVLGLLARESRFVQVERRMIFMKRRWSVPVVGFWEEARPLVANHRYRAFLGALTERPAELEEFAKFAEEFDASDLEATEQELTWRLSEIGPEEEKPFLWSRAASHGSLCARDLSQSIGDHHPRRADFSEYMLLVCPHSPYARALLLKYDWEKSKAKIEQWTKDSGDSAAFLQQLGTKLLDDSRFQEALPIWEKYVAVSADRSAYEKLAACYEGLGDEARWLDTLNMYLQSPDDGGLGHATVQVKLANYYLKHGEPKKAKPYSDAAAQTWAQWAMSCAAEVDEKLGELDEAAEWHRRNATRYPRTWASWYLFCRRTGHGDVDSATGMVRAVIRRPDALTIYQRTIFHWAEAEPDEAIRNLEADPANANEPGFALPLALLYDQIGAGDKRDALLKRIVEEMKDKAPKTIAVFAILRDSLADPSGPIDLAAVDGLVDPMPPAPRATGRLLIGRFLLNRGRLQDARKYLEPVVASGAANPWERAAAAAWLAEAFPNAKPAPKPKPEATPNRTSA